MLEDDAPDRDTQAESFAAVLRARSRALKNLYAQKPAMITTVRAIRHGTGPRAFKSLTGPLADRARFALIDDSTSPSTVETWELDEPSVAPASTDFRWMSREVAALVGD